MAPSNRFTLPSRIGVLISVVVLLAGLLTAFAVSRNIASSQDARMQDLMAERSTAIQAAVLDETQRYVDTLQNLSLALGSQSDLDDADFTSITENLPAQHLSGVTSVAYVEESGDNDVLALQERWRVHGVRDLQLHPETSQSVHKFVVMSRTLDGSTPSLGRDLSIAPEPTAALDLARQLDRVVTSETYVLLRDRSLPVERQQKSFVFVAPVLGGGTASDTGQFRGWLVMGMHGQDFMNETLQRVSQNLVNVTLADVGPDGDQVPVASFRGGTPLPYEKFERRITLVAGGNTWMLSMQPTHHMLDNLEMHQDEYALLGGAVVSVLLSGLILVLSRSRDRALRQVERATAQLHADIERREAVEKELREREAELTAFAGVVAHDLKSPLTAVLGYSELLQDSMAERGDAATLEYLGRVHGAGVRMRRLIDDLLSYATAKDAGLDIVEVDLDALVRDVVVQRTSEAVHCTAVFEIDELPVVQADLVMVRQLVDNLVGNAMKYVVPGTSAHVEVSAERSGDHWRITVADRGIGIAPQHRASVFAKFHRAAGSEGYAGTGLGLAICQRVVERHGGSIGVDGNPGGGSAFWFTLPATSRTGSASGRAGVPVERATSLLSR